MGRELDFLTHSGLDPNFVPEPGQRIFLSDLSNLHQGADLIDATDAVHRSYIEMVERALSHWPTMVLCGADVAIEDASQPLSEANHHILEFNCLPGFNGHHYPTQGQPRDVAGAIIDFLMGKRLLDAGADSRDGGKGVRLQKQLGAIPVPGEIFQVLHYADRAIIKGMIACSADHIDSSPS